MDKNSIRTVENFYPCGLNTEKECVLLIEIEGFKVSIEHQVSIVSEALKSSGASCINFAYDEKQKENLWTARRASYAATAKLAPDVVTDDIIVPRSKLADMVSGVQKICEEYGLKTCIVGHIGDGNLHPQIALNLDNDEEFKNCMEAKAKMYELVLSLGGSLTAEHGIGIEKRDYVNKFMDEYALEYMKRIKNLFDPNGILNPQKIFRV
jgi:glycolate oxidase